MANVKSLWGIFKELIWDTIII